MAFEKWVGCWWAGLWHGNSLPRGLIGYKITNAYSEYNGRYTETIIL